MTYFYLADCFSFAVWQKNPARCLFYGENNRFLTDPLSHFHLCYSWHGDIPRLHPLWQTVLTFAPELLQNLRDNVRGSSGAKPLAGPWPSAPACWWCRGWLLLTLECTIPMAAASNDPCRRGRQEHWRRLLLHQYLLPFLRRVSQLNHECVDNVQSCTLPNYSQGNFMNPSFTGKVTYRLTHLSAD